MTLTLNNERVHHDIMPDEGFRILIERRKEAYDCPEESTMCPKIGDAEAQCYDIMTQVHDGALKCCNICQLTYTK